jgi:hypothetical protein
VPDPVETRDPASAPVPRRRSSVWLFLIPGAVLILIGVAWMLRSERRGLDTEAAPAATGTSGAGAEGETTPTGPLNPAADGPAVIGDLSLLGGEDQYLGRAVELASVPVSSIDGPRTFTVGRLGHRTLVLLDSPRPAAIEAGGQVRISGTIEKPPSGGQLTATGLADADRNALADQEIIIHATRVEPAVEATPTPRPSDSP